MDSYCWRISLCALWLFLPYLWSFLVVPGEQYRRCAVVPVVGHAFFYACICPWPCRLRRKSVAVQELRLGTAKEGDSEDVKCAVRKIRIKTRAQPGGDF